MEFECMTWGSRRGDVDLLVYHLLISSSKHTFLGISDCNFSCRKSDCTMSQIMTVLSRDGWLIFLREIIVFFSTDNESYSRTCAHWSPLWSSLFSFSFFSFPYIMRDCSTHQEKNWKRVTKRSTKINFLIENSSCSRFQNRIYRKAK